MDRETYLVLSEGEAIHFSDGVPWAAPHEARSFNELTHIAQYRWFRQVVDSSGIEGPLLDVASGSGYGTHYLQRSGSVTKAIGVDVNLRHLAFAKAHFPLTEFVHGDAEKVDSLFPRASFAFITSGQTLEHLMDPVSFIRAVSLLLRDDGVFCLMTPTHNGSPIALKPKNPWHIFEFNPTFMLDLLSPHFDEIRMGDDRPCNDAFDIVRRIGEGIRIPTADAVYCSKPKRFDESKFQVLRSIFLEKYYRTIIDQAQARLVAERRNAHFLANSHELITFDSGWFPSESGQIWSMPSASFTLHPDHTGEITLVVSAGATESNPRTAVIRHSGLERKLTFTDGRAQKVEFSITSETKVQLAVEPPLIPSHQADIRALGLSVRGVFAGKQPS